jgi:iron complex outermembrane receptor protein
MLKAETVRSFLIAVTFTLSLVATAIADSPKHPVNIPAGDLSTALTMLAKQSGADLVYRPDQVKGLKTQGVSGSLSAEEALAKLLAGTPLTVNIDSTGAMLISTPKAHARSTSINDASVPAPSPGKEVGPPARRTQSSEPDSATSSGDSDKRKKNPKANAAEDDSGHAAGIPEILVKGSRIMNVDVTRTEDDAQPYYILDSQLIEQSGATNVEDFLKQRLTMNTLRQANNQQYGGVNGNTSTINLRGLGSNETLILIDGRRSASVSYVGVANQPDINGIPLAAIERIEILPSSASAIYGGAAVGGVVNIILKKNFQGGQVDVSYENTTSATAPLQSVSATYGFSLDEGKTQVMLSGHYADGSPLHLQDRLNLVQRGITTILRNSPSYLYNVYNIFPGATPNISSLDPNTNLTLKDGTPLNSPITSIPAGAAAGSNLSAGLLRSAGTYNLNLPRSTGQYGLQSTIGSVPIDKSLMATVRQEFTSNFSAFAEFSTLSNSSRSVNNPFGGPYTVPSTAPNNPFQENVSINFPSALAVPQTTDSVTQSMTVGFLARLSHDWSSELDYTWSRSSFEATQYYSDGTALGAALADGTVNPFADTLAHPLNLAPYLVPDSISGSSALNDLGLRISGPIGSFSWGQPVLTLGLEHRKEGTGNSNQILNYPLTPASNANTLYFGQSQSTNSIYAEALVPLVAAKNAVPLIRSLDLQLAGRSEHYDVFAGTPSKTISPVFFQQYDPPQGMHTTIKYTSTNPTIGLKWKPMDDLIFRASYSTAFLPPTASQFMPNPRPACGYACTPVTDPLNGATYNVDESFGGNPSLKPQTSRDWDFGVIFEPQAEFVKGLRIDLEYYKISQPDYITYPDLQQVVSNPAYASRVTRDPATGMITVVNLSPVNATKYETNGWDLKIDYLKSTDFGTFGLYALGTFIEHDKRQYTIGGPSLDYVGFPAELGEARIKANATLSWEYRQWKLGWTTTYYGTYLQDNAPGSPNYYLSGPNTYYTDAQGGFKIPSQMYHEIFASVVFNKASADPSFGIRQALLSNLTIQVAVKNLFNTLPPFDAASGPYFYSQYGDPRLRDYRLTLRKGF